MAIDQIYLIPGLGSELEPGVNVGWNDEIIVWENAEVFWGNTPPQVFWETDAVKWETEDVYWSLDSELS